MFKKTKLSTKMLGAFVVVGLVPFAVIGLYSMNKSTSALSKATYNQLISVRDIKKTQIEQYFKERQGDMSVLVETVGTLRKEAFDKLAALRDNRKTQIQEYFDRAILEMEIFARSKDVTEFYDRLVEYHIATGVQPDGAYDVTTPEYQAIYDKFSKNINQFKEKSGFYDVFMVCAAHGHVMYSAAKEKDLGSNLGHGPFKDSGLAELWAQVAKSKKPAMVDFKPYVPSNNEPSAFVGYPIFGEDGAIRGMMVVQLSREHINRIMTQRVGMGRTGETYLVGPDLLMRSDSFRDPEHHSFVSSFADPEKGRVKTQATASALKGETGVGVIHDYRGQPVLSAWTPVKLGGFTWALVAEIDVAEAFSPVDYEGKDYYAGYVERYGYADLFLLNPDGHVFYTVTRQKDYLTNMLAGEYNDSGLGKLVRLVMETKTYGVADFEPYAPAGGEPAGFIAQPVVYGGNVEIIVALRLPMDGINAVMTQRQGLGATGETYLVGPDKLMRSDSFLDPTNHSVKASFADPVKGKASTEATREALAGQTAEKIIANYAGHEVISAYAPVKVGDLTWALLAEVDETEAFAAVDNLMWAVGPSSASSASWPSWRWPFGWPATPPTPSARYSGASSPSAARS